MKAVLHENHMEQYEIVYKGGKEIEISGETVVPDKMPDIGLLGDTNAQVLLRTKRAEAGIGLMEGTLSVLVGFLPDGVSGVRVLNMELPWSAEFMSEAISDAGVPTGAVCVSQLETRMLNPRKILVKAKLVTELTVFEKRETVVCDEAEGTNVVQVCEESVVCSVISTVCEKTFAATDEYPLPAEFTGCEVIGKSVQFRVEDIKTLTNKLIVKGSVLSDLMVASENGETEKVSFVSGFSFIAETDCEQVSDDACICILPTALYYEPTSNGRVLSMEVHGVCQMTVYERKTMSYLSDAYSNFYPCECDFDTLRVFTDMKTTVQREHVTGTVTCRSQLSRVRFLTAMHIISDIQKTDRIGVLIGAYVQYENGMTDWIKKQITVALKRNTTERVTAVRLGELYAVSNGADVEYRMTVEYELREENVCEVRMLSAVTCDEEQPLECNRPSIVVVRAGGNLWELARKHGSTVSMIQTYNGLDEGETDADQLLLIPRQRK